MIVLIFALIYFVGVWYFGDRFCPNTYVDEQDVSFKNIETVEDMVKSQADHYALDIKTIDNRDQKISSKDIDLTFKVNDIVREMKEKQGSFNWFIDMFVRTDLHATPEIHYDEDKLKEVLFNLPIFSKDSSVMPADAFIDVKDNKFYIVNEIEGNVIKRKKMLQSVRNHILNNETQIDIDSEGLYKKPKIYRDDEIITKPMQTLTKYNTSIIHYEIEGANEVVDPTVFSSWVVIDKNNGNVSIDKEKTAAFVQALARKYDTWSLNREFKTTAGNTINVKGGSYGWLIERSAETDQLIADIEAGQEITREPKYRYKAKARVPNDIGNTYVEVDISKQRMWFYKDGKLIVETPVVTGRPTPSRHTPLGVYPLNYKTKNAVLRGQGYSSPVKLWMPFNNNIGIHDASWRANFGGQIYKTGGSHGCVNTPYAAVKQIYDNIEKGDPIVVYASAPYIIREQVAKPKKDEENKKDDKPKPVEDSEDEFEDME